jgi:crotonobetainyl-CoA:carnitine CoA-transferase CaiB-like acyl-CoA transferase
MIVELTHPLHGGYQALRDPRRLSPHTHQSRRQCVDLCEQTREILRGLDLGRTAIEDLLARGIVAEPVIN